MDAKSISQASATRAEIDLEAFQNNIRQLKSLIGNRKLLAVIKTNAYGHGVERIGCAAVQAGADRLGASTLADAVLLREQGITLPIQLLSMLNPEQAESVVSYQLIPSVSTEKMAKQLSQTAIKLGKVCKVHLKIDTGLHRFGMAPSQAYSFCQACYGLPGLQWEGIYTHFSCADEGDWETTEAEYHRFLTTVTELESAGFYFSLKHVGASTITLERKDMYMDMVRPGISLFGCPPAERQWSIADLEPVMTLKSRVLSIRELPVNTAIGYGGEYRTKASEQIAIIPIGIGDGYSRMLSNRGEVLIKGRRAPIVGVISLDQLFVNVTGIPDLTAGDEVVLIGKQGHDYIPATEVAVQMGSIQDEVLAGIMPRVPRIYLGDDE